MYKQYTLMLMLSYRCDLWSIKFMIVLISIEGLKYDIVVNESSQQPY